MSYSLPADYQDGVTAYAGATIRRLHGIVNTQLHGIVDSYGSGVETAGSFAVSEGEGLQVLVAPGSGFIRGDSRPSAFIARTTELALAVPASSTTYIWAIIENRAADAGIPGDTGNRTEESAKPLLLADDSDLMPNGMLLATVTTDATSVTNIVDNREVGVGGGGGGGGADGEDGVGVPAGGTTGQVLAKASSTDYDTEWVAPADGGGGGGGTPEAHAASHAVAGSDPITVTPAQITDIAEFVRDTVAAFFLAGAGITLTHDDGGNTLTILNSAPVSAESVQDIVGAMIAAGANITSTYNDAAGTVTIASTGGAAMTTEEVQDIVAGLLSAGTNVSLNYNDAGNLLSISATGSSPAAHAATHKHGGTDEVATATPTANAIPKAGSDGKLDPGWITVSGTGDRVQQIVTFNGGGSLSPYPGTTDLIAHVDSASASTLSLPAANAELLLTIKQIGTGVPTVQGTGGLLVDGASSKSTNGQQWSFLNLYSDGTNWFTR